MIAPEATPAPMPAFAPLLRPEVVLTLADAVVWEVDSLAALAGLEVLDDIAEVLDELVPLDVGLELKGSLVAILAAAPRVAKGKAAEFNRNLPTPVSQQLFV